MSISFRCPGCDGKLTVSDEMAGKNGKCKCGASVTIPAKPSSAPLGASPSSTISIDCPGCGAQRMVPIAYQGKQVRCPCGVAFLAEDASSSAPESVPAAAPDAGMEDLGATGTNPLLVELTEDDLVDDYGLESLEEIDQFEGQKQLAPLQMAKQPKRDVKNVSKPPGEWTMGQNVGLLFFVFLCGIPGLELAGFGFGLPITMPAALLCASLGGLIGGALVCPKPIAAGLLGGLVAGPLGLICVYLYTLPREEVYKLELVVVQGVASLPGVLVGYGIKWFVNKRG